VALKIKINYKKVILGSTVKQTINISFTSNLSINYLSVLSIFTISIYDQSHSRS